MLFLNSLLYVARNCFSLIFLLLIRNKKIEVVVDKANKSIIRAVSLTIIVVGGTTFKKEKKEIHKTVTVKKTVYMNFGIF